MLLRFRAWPDEQMKHFVQAYERGVPIIALRTSTHAFKLPASSAYASFSDFGKRVLGERWVNHWGNHKREATLGIIEPSAKDDPIFSGVSEVFGDSDVYEAYPPPDAKILLRVAQGLLPGLCARSQVWLSVAKLEGLQKKLLDSWVESRKWNA